MITGNIRNKIDAIWDAFWSGGISNPLEVIEQITYLLFLKRLDDLQTLEENKSTRLKKPMERRVFPEGKDPKGRAYDDLRWSRFKHFEPKEMFEVLSDHVFPFLRTLGGDDSTYAHHMKDARFTIPNAALLAKVVDMIDQVPMEDRDTKGDLYEYMLGKIASAGQNGQFRTPRHIIRLMVELTAPTAKDVICDPACGTAGFLVAAGEYLREHHPEILRDAQLKEHFHHHLFHGFDFDNTMLRIGSMNMLLHGVENPDTQSLFLDLFGDPITNSKSWKCAEMPDAVVGKYGIKAGPFGSSLKKEDYTTNGYRIYGQEQVIAGRFDIGDYYIGERKYQQLKSCAVAEGDLLVSLVGSFGKVLIVPAGIEPGIINPRLLKITPNQVMVTPDFLAALLQHPTVQAEFQRVAHGGTMGILNAGLLKQMKIILPPIELQREFGRRLVVVEKLKTAQCASLAELDALFASLQHRAFRGEL